MTNLEIFDQFLTSNELIQIATQSNGKLWICSVYFASDDNRHIYWTSARNRRHSIEIESSPVIAATIVSDKDKKQAVQMSGKAYRIPADESETAHKIYGLKLGQKDNRLDEVKLNQPDSRAYWVFKPDFIELWDEVNFPDSPKQRVEL